MYTIIDGRITNLGDNPWYIPGGGPNYMADMERRYQETLRQKEQTKTEAIKEFADRNGIPVIDLTA